MTRKSNDTYQTPASAIEPLLPFITFNDANCLDPCRGAGNIIKTVQNYATCTSWNWCEIQEGIDYFAYKPTKRFDIVITNPPFFCWRKFLTKSLSEADLVIYLLRLNVLGSGVKTQRAKFWNNNPPTHLFPLEKRPSFTNDGKTDGCDYAWYCWDIDGEEYHHKTISIKVPPGIHVLEA